MSEKDQIYWAAQGLLNFVNTMKREREKEKPATTATEIAFNGGVDFAIEMAEETVVALMSEVEKME